MRPNQDSYKCCAFAGEECLPVYNHIMDVLDSDFYVEVVIKVGGEEVFWTSDINCRIIKDC